MPESSFRTGLLIGGLAVAVIGLAVALVLTAGDDDGDETETATIVSTAATPPTTSTATTTTATTDEGEFKTPSGNIICRVDAEAATCAAVEISYETPPVPASCADISEYGHVVSVGTTASADFVCADDVPAPYESPVLPYGKGVLVGPFACGSSEDGVRCANRETRHGFQIAREAVRLF